MTFLRHAPRHVHQTVVDYLTTQLTALDWFKDNGDAPFGSTPVRLSTSRPFVGSKINPEIGDGTLTVTLGHEFDADPQEMGGPMSEQEMPFFCDIFMADESIALALAADVRDTFYGRHANGVRSLPVIDQVTGMAAPGWRLSFEEIQRITPEHAFPLAWQSVQVTAVVTFQEVIW